MKDGAKCRKWGGICFKECWLTGSGNGVLTPKKKEILNKTFVKHNDMTLERAIEIS